MPGGIVEQADHHASCGRYAQAERGYREALRHDPDLLDAAVGLAVLLGHRGNTAAAADRLELLCRSHPGTAGPWAALGAVRFDRGEHRAALTCYERVLDLDPDWLDSRIGFAWCLARRPALVRQVRSRRHVVETLEHEDVDPALLVPAALLLVQDSPQPLEEPLLASVLRQAVVTDPAVEVLLVEARRDLCLDPPAQAPALASALAAQVNLNEGVWPVSRQERVRLESAPQWVRDMYLPAEAAPAPECPALTVIEPGTSHLVREQYESNPYPRWQRLSRETPQPLDGYLRALTHGRWDPPAFLHRPRVLAAGCGTGREMLTAAWRWEPASVTGVDLSATSLSFAQRQADRLGLHVDLLRADLTQLGGWDREFDVIICTGVLHHLDDPFAGWRTLVELLRPGGVMLIGLYSRAAREGITHAQTLVRDLPATPEGIRAAREVILGLPSGHPARDCLYLQDFYYLSGCRDLLLHVQERHFTIPEIAAALDDLGLDFRAMETPATPLCRTLFGPQPTLADWDTFERLFPRTFLGMYQFWCQRYGEAQEAT